MLPLSSRIKLDYSTMPFQSSYMKLALSGADTDIERAESLKEAEAEAKAKKRTK